MAPQSDRTRLIAGATRRGRGRRPVNPPIERASTLLNDSAALMRDPGPGPVYGIEDLGAAGELRSALSDLEGARWTGLVPSGLAAVTVPVTALTRPGDEVLTTDAVYGPSRRFLTRHLAARGVTSRFHQATASTEAVIAALTDRTRVLLIESPASLTFDVQDVAALAAACRARGGLTVMDNTWGAGLAFRPLAHGVDVSVQAVTKYVGGHSDLLMGSIAVADPAVGRPRPLRTWAGGSRPTTPGWRCAGCAPCPCAMASRGVRPCGWPNGCRPGRRWRASSILRFPDPPVMLCGGVTMMARPRSSAWS